MSKVYNDLDNCLENAVKCEENSHTVSRVRGTLTKTIFTDNSYREQRRKKLDAHYDILKRVRNSYFHPHHVYFAFFLEKIFFNNAMCNILARTIHKLHFKIHNCNSDALSITHSFYLLNNIEVR